MCTGALRYIAFSMFSTGLFFAGFQVFFVCFVALRLCMHVLWFEAYLVWSDCCIASGRNERSVSIRMTLYI